MANVSRKYGCDQWTTTGKTKGKKGIEFLLGSMPMEIWDAGIEKARLEGHPKPMKYWSENNYKQYKKWMNENPYWKTVS